MFTLRARCQRSITALKTSTRRGVVAAIAAVAIASACDRGHQQASGDVDGNRVDIYARTRAGDLSATAERARPLVYVPNSLGSSVSEIDPTTYTVVRTFHVGSLPQHVVPSYDLSRLWVLSNKAGTVTPIDPHTGMHGRPIRVRDPYNMYYTPDGHAAMVVAEAEQRLDFRDPRTMRLVKSVPVDCKGINHLEFTIDQRYLIATCEFGGALAKVDLVTDSVVGTLALGRGPAGESMPQDIRSSPDGRVFYVADMVADGVWLIDPVAFHPIGFLSTGVGAHGIYPSRDGRLLYITNRGSHSIRGAPKGPGSVSVVDPSSQTVVANWPIPGGGSPDMGNVTADGRELWVSGRFDDEVYVFDTRSGRLTHRIPVGREPHGLCVWPQPGSRSLGHTGNMR
ncbi:MAG TPA: YncE family protein [Gemmatimonadaceae bacterium]